MKIPIATGTAIISHQVFKILIKINPSCSATGQALAFRIYRGKVN